MADLSITTEIVGLEAVLSGVRGIDTQIQTMGERAKKAAEGLTSFGQSLSIAVTAPLTALAKSSLDAEAQLTKLTTIFKTATGSAEEAGRQLGFIKDKAEELGVPFSKAAEQFGKLLISSQAIAKDLPQAQAIFTGFAEALRALGATQGAIDGAFTALTQMASKGQVSMEELRQQLGEHLPGAFEVAARAMGVTTAQLDEMVSKGTVTADVLLPKMAAELHKTFAQAAQENANAWPAVVSRFQNALFDLQVSLGQSGVTAWATSITSSMTDVMRSFTALDQPTKEMITAFGGIALAVGPAALVLGKTLEVVIAMATPWRLAAAAVAALITAFDGWDEIGAAVSGAWDVISRFVTDVQSAFADLVSNSDSTSESVGLAIGAMAGAIAVGAGKALDAIGTLADDLLAMFDRAMADGDWGAAAGQAVDAVSDAMSGLWDAVSPSIDEFVKGLLDGFDRATGGDIRRTFDEFVSWVGEAAGRMADGFVDGFKGVVDRVAAAWDDIKETIRRKVGEIAEVIPAPVRAAMDTVTSTIETGVDKASGVLSSTTEAMGRVWTQGLNFFGVTTEQAMQDGVIVPMEEMQREVVGQSIIPDTVAMILESWRGLMEMTPLTERAVSEQIAGFEALKQQITQWGNDVRTIMGDQTLTIDDQKAKLAELRAAMEEMGATGTDAYRRVLEAQKDLASQTPTILEGMKQGWVSYYNEVTNLGKSAAEATAEGLRTVQGTLSEFFKTGKLDFTSLKEFALQTYADMAAQATMSMVVQSGNAFKEWLFGAQASATGVQAAVEGSMTGAAAATTGFGTQAQGVFSGLWEFVTAGFGGMLTSITGILGGLLTFFTDLLTQIGGLFSSLWASIVEGASGLMGSLGELLGGLGGTVGGVVDTVGGLFGGLWDGITTAGGVAMDAIGGAMDLFGIDTGAVMDTVSTGWSTLFGGMNTTATDTLGVVNSGVDLTGVTFGETMGGMTVASDVMFDGLGATSAATFEGISSGVLLADGTFGTSMANMATTGSATFGGLGEVADYTFTGINGGILSTDGTFTDAMGNILSSGSKGFSTLSANSLASLGTISGGIALVANAANILFSDLSQKSQSAISAIGGVGTALAGLASGNPLLAIAGAAQAAMGVVGSFSSYHNQAVTDIVGGQIRPGTATNPDPANTAQANRVAAEALKIMQKYGLGDAKADVSVQDTGTKISVKGVGGLSRQDNDPDRALQQFDTAAAAYAAAHPQGFAQGGVVVTGLPWSMPGSRDNVLAPLQTGEFVVRREAARQFHPLLDAINRGQVTSRTIGNLAQAGMGIPGATVGPNVVVRFFDELDGAWETLADQADSAFEGVTSTVEQWREAGSAKVTEFAETSKARLDELAPKSVEVFAGMGETLRLWVEDGSVSLTEFVAATGERLGELVPLTDDTMKAMGETLVAWIDDGLLGWDAYATGVTTSHDLVAEHHAMRVGEMGLGWTETTTRMGDDQRALELLFRSSVDGMGLAWTTSTTRMGTDQARLEAETTASYRAVGAYATSTLAAINSAFAAMVAAAVARLAQLRAEAGATISAINGEVAAAEANIARARAEAASIPAPGGGYDKDRGFATGGDAVFTSPTRIMVAEQGPEHISARPLGRGRGAGSGQTLVFQGPVIANDLSMTQLARRLMREVEREQKRRR